MKPRSNQGARDQEAVVQPGSGPRASRPASRSRSQSRPTLSPRAAAQNIFHDWQRGSYYAAELIDRLDAAQHLPPLDRAFLQDLVLTVLRHLTLLDHWTATLTEARRLDDATRWLLRAGLAEVLLLNHAHHAAVHENVGLARRAGGLVNAVLRRACREKDALLTASRALPPAVRLSHPDFLLKRWQRQFGGAVSEALALWNQQPAPVYVRLNRLQTEASAALAALPGLESAGRDFFLCRQLPLVALRAGWCYAQDPSTALAPDLAAAQPGMTVLDACAAPGGKTAILAQHMRNQGRLIAADLPGHRLRRLEDNLRRLGVTCAEVRGIDWLAGPETRPDWLPAAGCDLILLDAPCSNTGVMRRRVDVRWRLTEAGFIRLVEMQRRLLERLLPLLKPGGRLVYSTCSIDTEENEGQLDWLRATLSGVAIDTIGSRLPQRDAMDGAFAAVLRLKTRP